VQVVGRKFEEEKVLAITMIVDAAVKNYLGTNPEVAGSKALNASL
jgi:hypothetical protein